MGQAKLRRSQPVSVVYHHTSTLRTNLLWMSGVVEVEGRSKGAFHPQLGEVALNASLRRGMQDFPPLAWFTRRIEIPRCLLSAAVALVDKTTGQPVKMMQQEAIANGIALNRVAIGFRLADVALTPWPEHPGFGTDEGRELNETACEVGDNPLDWYVSEEPVDLLRVSEFWSSKSRSAPRLERHDHYVADIHRMVRLCRDTPGAFIPPTWLGPDRVREVARRLGLPVAG